MSDLLERLRQSFQGRVCLMGLGNPDYGDDGLGVYLTKAVALRLTTMGEDALARHIVSAGAMPERFIGPVQKMGYDHLLFVDAVEFNGEPGSVVLLEQDEMSAKFPQISTHKISVSLLAKVIGANGRTNVRLLGVQPGSLRPGQPLSPAVQKTVDILVNVLCDMFISPKRTGGGHNNLTHGENLNVLKTAEVRG